MPNVDYLLNDSYSPLQVSVPIPSSPTDFKILVDGYTGKPGAFETLQQQAMNTFITVASSIGNNKKVIAKSGRSVDRWAAVSTLRVVPRAGKDLNAYYDRMALRYFYYPVGKVMLYLVDSTDVVAHELGHATLDAMRPDFWSVQSLEIWSFHEAFADINALMTMLAYPAALENALKEVNNDIRKSNIITRLAEQLGAVLYGKRHLYLRDAVNTFKYVDPSSLPEEAPDDQLCAECHSFGRVFLGTWWEIVAGIYEQEKKQSTPIDALTAAKNVAHEYLYKAIVQSPLVSDYHHAIARGMMVVDRANGGKYQDILRKAFVNRNMMPPEIKMMSDIRKKDLKIDKEKDLVVKRGKTTTVVLKGKKTIRLLDHHSVKRLSALDVGAGNLGDIKLEVPFDTYYEFDENGALQHQMLPDENTIVEEARRCSTMIAHADNLGKKKMWKISRKKLVRSFIE